MGQAPLIGHQVRRAVRLRFLKWRTVRNPGLAIEFLDAIVPELERCGWRCVKTYQPEVFPVLVPSLRVYGAGFAVTLCVLAVQGGGWAFHEAPRGRGGYLCLCDDQSAEVVDRFLRERSSAR